MAIGQHWKSEIPEMLPMGENVLNNNFKRERMKEKGREGRRERKMNEREWEGPGSLNFRHRDEETGRDFCLGVWLAGLKPPLPICKIVPALAWALGFHCGWDHSRKWARACSFSRLRSFRPLGSCAKEEVLCSGNRPRLCNWSLASLQHQIDLLSAQFSHL